MRSGRHLAATIALVALCALALAASASASHSFKEQISIGPTGGNGAIHAFFDGASQDGTRAVFETSESLVSGDTDAAFDIYERVGNTTALVSTGPSGGNGPSDAFFNAVSADGSRVIFDTDESLVAADTDTFVDIYQRSGGVTTLISTGPSGGNGAFDVTWDGISKDGSHVIFETDEALVATDTNGTTDIYDRAAGTTKLITSGTAPGIPVYDGNSDDGTRIFFDTDDALAGTDTDTQFDVYERFGASITLISTGTTGGNGAFPARYVGNSQSGTRVWFETNESLVAGDTDGGCGVPPTGCNDVYQRSGGATTQISTGANGAFDAFFDGASGDGSHVVFHTAEPLAGGDTDTQRDVYDRTGGTTVRVSTGPTGGNGPIDATFSGLSLDGSRIFFETTEALVTDTDVRQDIYERVAATTTNRVSTGASGGNGAFDAFFDGSSLDGGRVFFSTSEPLEPATDTDTAQDVYERFGVVTTHITFGPSGGNAALGAFFDAASADGSRVFFDTRESLVATDTDTTRDVYAATIGGYARPRGATPLRASLVPAYLACGSPNRSHGAPLSHGSCNPPAPASAQLTVGSPDSNGEGSNFQGFVHYTVVDGGLSNDADVKIAVSITDVRHKVTLADYAGQVQVDASVRITDHKNGSSGTEPATGVATSFPVTVPCVSTASTTVGGTCAVSTTFNAVTPGAIAEGQRAIWELGETKVFDGGPDGLASTGPNTLFADQGIFVP